ncbi:hypothetical protein CH63R_06109 [Colletotrichum higginsianum IMI 349063]|uniref:Uncharacterized protein n=1 Tax=Colletotrichum higginsianum (strain IMI 349063) TaxID=759273 RepID=A0A1B7YEA4_COLHI|nr:hypothetical protein CH63R_06109 [Colletotrichum higginsianum IMI 349063]OBR10417.1 hypothetical protein CH63R_06109 [Colletotrichum higginsianum IMI 349063]
MSQSGNTFYGQILSIEGEDRQHERAIDEEGLTDNDDNSEDEMTFSSHLLTMTNIDKFVQRLDQVSKTQPIDSHECIASRIHLFLC